MEAQPVWKDVSRLGDANGAKIILPEAGRGEKERIGLRA